MPIPFAVSIEEPPPKATIKSAPDTLNADTPFCTFAIVGLALTSLKISYGISFFSNTSH